jgi:hypothetical protein
MSKTSAAFLAALLLGLTACSKGPPVATGSGALKLKDPVWATYGWSRNRMSYIIYFVPNTTVGFNPDGVAATVKAGKDKEGDVFDGGLDGYPEKSKSSFKVEPKKGEVSIEGRMYRGASVFLVKVGTPSKVEQIQGTTFSQAPKDPEEWAAYAEAEVKRIAKENPKIAEFPKEPPAPDKPGTKKK